MPFLTAANKGPGHPAPTGGQRISLVTLDNVERDEGNTVVFSFATPTLPDNTTLYWQTEGSVNANDFADSILSGTITTNNQTATLSRQIRDDQETEGSDNFRIVLSANSDFSTRLFTTPTISINDSSLTPGTTFIKYTTPGSYTFTVPDGVTSISYAVVGGGGGGGAGRVTVGSATGYFSGGGGGALAYRNNVAVTPGDQVAVVVGSGGVGGVGTNQSNNSGQFGGDGTNSTVTVSGVITGATGGTGGRASYASGANNVWGGGPGGSPFGTRTGGGFGGLGGANRGAGGGGGGGFTGDGGRGGTLILQYDANNGSLNDAPVYSTNGAGGGGGGGGWARPVISGQVFVGNRGGSAGGQTNGLGNQGANNYDQSVVGGTGNNAIGGGAGGGSAGYNSFDSTLLTGQTGENGVVLIMWPGSTRQFPNTNILDFSASPAIPPTYEVVESSSTINEGGSVSFAVNTTNVSDGTTLYWTIQNISSASSALFPNGISGTVAISNNTGNVAISTTNVNDSRFFDVSGYIFALQLRVESTEGTIVATSNQVTVNNTWAARVYTTAGSHTFTVPQGVTKISYAVIGGGGGGAVGSENFGAGGGGACAYRNNVTVTPGQTVAVFVGAGGSGAPSTILNSSTAGSTGSTGQTSYVEVSGVRTNAGGGQGGLGGSAQSNGGTISGTYTGGGAGGKGGAKLGAGGGGAGGFTGAGGNGARWWSPSVSATAGSGGGGGGGGSGRINSTSNSARGGYGGSGGGQTSGAAGPNTVVIGSGNNGGSGADRFASAGSGAGAYGGNSGSSASGASGATGAVMIIWDGSSRQWPSTNIVPFG